MRSRIQNRSQPVVNVSGANKKERKPDVTARKLKKQGYKYKMEELTPQQLKEQREGIKEVDEKGKVHTYEPPDYNYYYKTIGDATVKIFKVGDKFIYNGGWFRYMDTLPLIEQRAKANAVYEALEAKVKDTPLVDTPTQPTAALPDIIELADGPLHGKSIAYDKRFPVFMTKIKNEDTGKLDAVRYKSPMTGSKVYVYLDTIPG